LVKECQAEFENLIYKLANAPVLQSLSVNNDFYMFTDGLYFGAAMRFSSLQITIPIYSWSDNGGNALIESYRSWNVLQIEL
jgi:hypothetical protein